MFEPNNAFEFAGYFLTDLVDKLANNEDTAKVGCYGGDLIETTEFGNEVLRRGYEEGLDLFLNNPPQGVRFAYFMRTVPLIDETPEWVHIEVFDYQERTRGALALPFQRRKRFQQLKVGNLETLEIWGQRSAEWAFREIVIFSTLAGSKAYPNAREIWAGKYESDSKIASAFQNN